MKNKNGKSRVFYATLAVCLAVTGTVTYFSTKGIFKIPMNTDTTKNQTEVTTKPVTVTSPTTTKPEPKTTEKPTTEKETEPTDDAAAVGATPNVKRAAGFSMPLGTTIGKDFSNSELVQSKTMGDWRVHNGIDFKGTVGDPVKAVNNGYVKRVYDDAMWGTVVEIDHGEGMVARYCGLGKGSTIKEGEDVKINDKIGNVGTVPIEIADDCHLHFEILQDGIAVDPLLAMGKTEKSE